jgi:hypothetical protein
MLYPKHRKARRGPLKNLLAMAFGACLLGIASLGAGVCQTPGYGDKPDQWAPYESGQYADYLQKIIRTYRFSDGKIAHLHFEEDAAGVGPVELFRISSGLECNESNCYFVLFASDVGDAPLITECQFKQAGITHFFNPDRSHFWGFEFSCKDTLLHVQVTKAQFWATSILKTPGKR